MLIKNSGYGNTFHFNFVLYILIKLNRNEYNLLKYVDIELVIGPI